MSEMGTGQITLRPATSEDCRDVWKWRNAYETRRVFFDQSYIPYKKHQSWYLRCLQATDARIFIIQDYCNRNVGYVRFNILADEAEISISLEQSQRGKGYGSIAIRQSSDQLMSTGTVRRIVAHVKPDNATSIAAFCRAGFILKGAESPDKEAIEMVYGIASDDS